MNGSIRKRGKGAYELTINQGHDANGKRRWKFVAARIRVLPNQKTEE